MIHKLWSNETREKTRNVSNLDRHEWLASLTNCSIFYLTIEIHFPRKIQMYIYSSFYFLISYICLVISRSTRIRCLQRCVCTQWSIIVHTDKRTNEGVFLYTHWTELTIRSFPVLSDRFATNANIESSK